MRSFSSPELKVQVSDSDCESFSLSVVNVVIAVVVFVKFSNISTKLGKKHPWINEDPSLFT
jgi:hypothetical protein